MMRLAALTAALLLAFTTHGGARGQVSAETESSGAATTGPIEIGGAEPVLCGALFDQPSATVDLTATASHEVGVEVSCNARFRLSARSSFGELRHESAYMAADQRSLVPYDVAWPGNLLDSNGSPIAPGFTASGAQWAAGISATSAPTRLTQSGRMRISWRTPTNVLAGGYRDIFFLDIEPN
jgi:hypothetical protein